MQIQITSNKGFSINSLNFVWGESRTLVRQKLNNQHQEDDRVIELSLTSQEGSNSNIIQKRDIYEDANGEQNFFFLNYNKQGYLIEIEVHEGINIQIENVLLEFEKDISAYLKLMHSNGFDYVELNSGNYFFEKLHITIASSQSMGGTGNGLSYFYFGKNVDHLVENGT